MSTYTEEQLEILKNAKPDNYITIRFTYSCELIFPFEDGIALLKHMNKAEQFGEADTITPVVFDSVSQVRLLSQTEYIQRKMKHLLEPNPTEDT